MLRRVLRAVLFAIVTVALWTVARPANAAVAPMCDDRGASMIASPPTLQAPDAVLAQAATSHACDGEDFLDGRAVAPGHAPRVVPASQGDPALVPVTPMVPPPAVLGAARAWDSSWIDPSGVRSRVERPPRG
jgi:hypothetical protein